jgi:ferric-dicitrate binding protein FerR (iron transport regulator)/TolA-binding protein
MMDEEQDAAPSVARMAKLAHERLGAMSDVQNARGLDGAMMALAQINAGKGKRFAGAGWPVWAAAVSAFGFALWFGGSALLRDKPLTYSIRGGEIQAGGYFRASARDRGPLVEFSDGTRLELMPGSRGRVASVEAHGARLMLDEGEAEVHVTPKPDARWWFDAGPFVVHVTGTEFRLAWRGGEGRLDVRLHKGAVSVSGPVAAQPIELRPGQWLTVRLATREVFVRDDDEGALPGLGAQPATTTPNEAPAPAPAAVPSLPLPLPQRRLGRAAPATSADKAWGPARNESDWQRIVDSATRRGLERSLAERSSEDLALLADAAYYLHRNGIAEQALLAQRRRFPGSTRARDAAFLLGRIVESRPGGVPSALAWYERHLSEAPSGAYASEALGRKMTLLRRSEGEIAARPVAEEYLRRYPNGTYAPAARAYVEKP